MFSAKWTGWAKLVFLFSLGFWAVNIKSLAQSQSIEEYFREDAINLNPENYFEWRRAAILSLESATDWQWLNWARISPAQLANLKEWKKVFGPVQKVWQLNAIEGFDSLTIDRIAQLSDSTTLNSALPTGILFPKNYGLLRHSFLSEGNRPWSQARIQLQKNNWRLGLNMGLVWFKTDVYKQYTSPQIGLFTGFIERKIKDRLKVVIGNQSFRSGLGLVNGGAWRPNSALRLEQSFSQPSGLMGVASNFSQWTPQGFGMEYASQSIQAMVFIGLHNLPVSNLSNTGSRSIRLVNWRQPLSTIATDTHTLGKTIASYLSKNLGSGFWLGSSLNIRYTSIEALPEGYNRSFAAFSSKSFSQASLDLKKVFGRFIFQAEWAIGDNENKAFQVFTKWAATQRIQVSGAYRRASRWYMAPMAQAYTQNTRPGNEEGVWIATAYRKKAWEAILTSDIYRLSPTYSFTGGNPWKHEHQGQIRKFFPSGWDILFRVRVRPKVLGPDELTGAFPSQWVISVSSPMQSLLSSTFHLQLSNNDGLPLSGGFWQDFTINAGRWNMLSRTGYWSAQNSLLYRFEPGLLYMPQTAVFSGNGFQQLTRLRFNFTSTYLLELRANWRQGRAVEWAFQITARNL